MATAAAEFHNVIYGLGCASLPLHVRQRFSIPAIRVIHPSRRRRRSGGVGGTPTTPAAVRRAAGPANTLKCRHQHACNGLREGCPGVQQRTAEGSSNVVMLNRRRHTVRSVTAGCERNGVWYAGRLFHPVNIACYRARETAREWREQPRRLSGVAAGNKNAA